MADARKLYIKLAFRPASIWSGGKRTMIMGEDELKHFTTLHAKLGSPSFDRVSAWEVMIRQGKI